jgi:small subunit ribosomal protein S6
VTEYEILLLLDPELTEEQQADVVTRTRDLIEKGGGTVDRHDAWGRRKLAYEIEKKSEGSYHLLLFSSTAETLDEVSRVLKIDDAVLRHMATRRVGSSLSEPVAVGEPASEDAGDGSDLAAEEEEERNGR